MRPGIILNPFTAKHDYSRFKLVLQLTRQITGIGIGMCVYTAKFANGWSEIK